MPAIAINAQLTEAIADNSTSPHGSRPPCLAVSMLIVRPPDPRRGVITADVPLAWDYHSPGRFQPRQRKRATRPYALFTWPDFRSGGCS
ncbi:hypothetical protein GCM10010317_038860 [Streptomyces mirabilis]|nr:hypothetical protein GCM10010317_038860 [Streptomyces mirabilis]